MSPGQTRATASEGAHSDPVVEVEDACVAIEGRRIVHDVSLNVAAGEFVALMGANGSGKSTLVRAMTGVLPIESGTMRVLGSPIERLRERHRIGYVPQRGGATSGVPASVFEVVASGRISRRRLFSISRAADRRAVTDALGVVDLADRANERVSALSGGQQQRVLIARALAAEPEILFLDEPTAGVDLPNQEALAEALGRLSERGTTIVLVAHELGLLGPHIDRCVVLRDGRVAYDGLPLTEVEVHAGAPGVPLRASASGRPTGPGRGTEQPEEHVHHDHVPRPHEPDPHECGPGHSDAAPQVSGPFDRSPEGRGVR